MSLLKKDWELWGQVFKIGLGVLTIAGTYATINWLEKILNKVERELTRYKTKKVVKEKFNGNEKLLNIVDDLSDNELNSLNQIVLLGVD